MEIDRKLQASRGEFLKSSARSIKHVLSNKLFEYGGVYALWKPDGSDPILYIGQSDNILRRIRNHQSNTTKNASHLNQFILNTSYPKTTDSYLVRVQKISDMGDRTRLENYLRATLNPKFNRE